MALAAATAGGSRGFEVCVAACIALVSSHGRWLLDATPDLPAQLAALGPPAAGQAALDGIVLTRGAEVGQLASPGGAHLFRLGRAGGIEMRTLKRSSFDGSSGLVASE